MQLIAALKQHSGIVRAIGRERDRRAIHTSRFNAALNGVGQRFAVVRTEDELRRALDGQPIGFAMSNPPFLAMPAWIDLDAEDCVSLRGLMNVRETDTGCQGDLRSLFPESGWGGDDGLAVTKPFIDELLPLVGDHGCMVIYSQFAGDRDGPRLLRDYIQQHRGFRFAFESVKPRPLVMQQPGTSHVASGETRTVLTAGEAATSVARLIVAALLAREHPERVRLAVPKGGREDAWQTTFAARIEASYRRHCVTHFYDGFVVLTKVPAQ